MSRPKGFTITKRENVFNKFNGKCSYCGTDLDFNSFVIDHIIPISKGGSSKYENLLPSCRECNMCKFDLSIEEFREKITNFYAMNDFKFIIFSKYYKIVPKRKEKIFYFERINKNGR